MNTTFDTLIHRILQERNINLTKFYKELADLGLNITYPSLYAYYTGTTVPPYSMAKRILKLARSQVSNEDLEQILEYSKKYNMKEKIPYEGSKKTMYLVEDTDNKEKLRDIVIDTCKDLSIKNQHKPV